MIQEPARLPHVSAERVSLTASRHPSAATVIPLVAEHVEAGSVVVVACSGGIDSLALLAICLAASRRRTPMAWRLLAVHVDHGLRPESEREADFVADLAARLEVPVVVRRVSWPVGDARPGGAAVRAARWAVLDEIAVEVGASAILTGHHAEDQAETVLLRAARGTGPGGLAGIPLVRRNDLGVSIVRPLLGCRRADLHGLVDSAGLPWIEDPTNLDTERARERVRHEVLPILEEIHPGAIRHLAELASSLQAGRGPEPTVIDEHHAIFDREACRTSDPLALATALRSVAVDYDSPAAAVARRVWVSAARMAVDEEVRPRRVRFTPGVELRVGPRDVRLVRTSPGEGDATEPSGGR